MFEGWLYKKDVGEELPGSRVQAFKCTSLTGSVSGTSFSSREEVIHAALSEFAVSAQLKYCGECSC